MEIDGWFMMFYDKYNGGHGYNNELTMTVNLTGLFESNYTQFYNEDAIKNFDKFAEKSVERIPNNLDMNLYQIIIFKNGNKESHTVVGVNIELLKKLVETNKQIPNKDFLLLTAKYHTLLNKAQLSGGKIGFTNDDQIINDNTNAITKNAIDKTGDIVDPMVENPKFLNISLFPYQKRSVNWLLGKEKLYKSVNYSVNDEIIIGDVCVDVYKQSIYLENDKKKIIFRGGALIDEVGLGKTIQMATMALLNQSTNINYYRSGSNNLFSRATLVLCPNQLCGQWKRELEDKIAKEYDLVIIPLLTKVHFDKYTYNDILDADFVITSYSFLDNKAFLDPWMKKVSTLGTYHRSRTSVFDTTKVKNVLADMAKTMFKNPSILTQTNVLLPLINWHRIIVDEFHEVYTVAKYQHVINLLPLFDAKYKWCVTGTPFDKGPQCLYNMIDFTTGYTNQYKNKILSNPNVKNHMMSNFFRRNTKKSVTDEYKLPQLKEKVVWLKFTPTERMMYNAYLANQNNDKFSVFLRQLCCHPKLSEEIKTSLSNCKTLEDVEKVMVTHYENSMKNSDKKVKAQELRIKIMEARIRLYEYKRQKRILKKMGYKVIIENTEEDIQLLSSKIELEENEVVDMSIFDVNDSSSDDDDDEKEIVIVSASSREKVLKLIGKKWEDNKVTLCNMYDTLKNQKDRLKELFKDYEGKKTTFEFYSNVIERIRKTTARNKDATEIRNEDDDEICGICLGEIPENDIGVTKCGHMYCYQCIKSQIATKAECPYCRKVVKESELYMISYEKQVKKEEVDKELKDKQALINEVGTKLANLIYYLKKYDNHTIIFSQWDDLLHKVGDILNKHGIKNAFCKGNVWQRDKAIRTFNQEKDVKVIMLSSESAASGTNLTKASQVILLDPVYGTYEFRKNTEWQAVGRAHRMGQTKEVEVIRFIIRDTVEEEIYKMNLQEDKKLKLDIKIFEDNEDSITLDKDKLKEIENSVKNSKEKTPRKNKKDVKEKKNDVV